MNVKNKVRILSHEPMKSDHRINKIIEKGPHMLKKVPSGRSDANSPLRLT
jgi:hypothetical protein